MNFTDQLICTTARMIYVALIEIDEDDLNSFYDDPDQVLPAITSIVVSRCMGNVVGSVTETQCDHAIKAARARKAITFGDDKASGDSVATS